MKEMVNKIRSNQHITYEGKKIRLTLGELYGGESFDDSIDRFKSIDSAAKLYSKQLEGKIFEAIENPQEGETRIDAVMRAYTQYIQELEKENGPLDEITRGALQSKLGKIKVSAGEDGLITSNLDPGKAQLLNRRIDTYEEEDFIDNVAEMKNEVYEIAETMDPEKSQSYIDKMIRKINSKRDVILKLSNYSDIISDTTEVFIQSKLNRYYGVGKKYAIDRNWAGNNLQVVLTRAIKNALSKAVIDNNNEPLNDIEAKEIANNTVTEFYNNYEKKNELYPGAKSDVIMGDGLIPVPSRDLNRMIEIITPELKSGQKVRDLLTVDRLDSFPNRQLILRQYQTIPILRLESIRQTMADILNGKPVPIELEKARVDSGAPNAYDFLINQLKLYGNYDVLEDFTEGELKNLEGLLSSIGGVQNSLIATAKLRETHPRLAEISSWSDPYKEQRILFDT